MKIPVSFEYEGVQFDGYLSKVSGAGSTATYHLMINNYFRGQLFNTPSGWRFGSNNNMFEENYMVEFFVNTIEQYLKETK